MPKYFLFGFCNVIDGIGCFYFPFCSINLNKKKLIKYLSTRFTYIPSTFQAGLISAARRIYYIQNNYFNDITVISICGKTSSQTNDEKAK